MIGNYLLNSTAMFAAPDAPGSDSGGTDQVADIGGSPEPAGGAPEGGEAPAGGAAPEPAKEDHSKPRVETISDSVKRAVTETKEKEAAAVKAKTTKAAAKAKDSTQAGAETGDAAKPGSETTAEGNTETAPQAQSAAPKAWSKEEKALWNDLPEAARAAITRREADTEKGVNELRTRYQEIDTAIAPYKAVMTQNNVTPGQAINQLFKWHMELAGPNKVEAFRQLAKSFGVDPATIAAAPATTEKPKDANPDNSIPENLRPVITNLETRLKTFEERESAAMQNAAKQTWQNWSKDKPHAETVRVLMANLINSDLAFIQAGQPQISNTIKNGSIDMDAAYEAAKYAHPEVRAAIIQEDQAKRDKEARAAAERARKAGASLKSGAPAGPISTNSSAAPRNETVAESIKRALAEVRGTQH
jgi:hypothetical protein